MTIQMVEAARGGQLKWQFKLKLGTRCPERVDKGTQPQEMASRSDRLQPRTKNQEQRTAAAGG